MNLGISTASLFEKKSTEEALEFLSKSNIKHAEVFLSTYCEYNTEFGKLLKSVKGETNVHSVHVLNTQFEPQLYSVNPRARNDSFEILKGAMACAKEINAKYYTFHGVARYKKTPIKIDFDRVGKITQEIIDCMRPYGVQLSYENVHWAYYNYIGFYSELKKRVPELKGVLDIKQARQSGIEYKDYISEMGSDIVTVHLSDIDDTGKMCLPSARGTTDFYDLFSRLRDVGFDGTMLLEVYNNDYDEYSELFSSLDYVSEISEKVFKK